MITNSHSNKTIVSLWAHKSGAQLSCRSDSPALVCICNLQDMRIGTFVIKGPQVIPPGYSVPVIISLQVVVGEGGYKTPDLANVSWESPGSDQN